MIPTHLLDRPFACDCGLTHHIPTRHISVGRGALDALPEALAKVASRTQGIPYLVCATAPSMNGYPSINASVLEGALKVTRPAQGPAAIVADLAILCAAPLPMIRAGLGDLLSQRTALVDWRLASLVQGTKYCAAVQRPCLTRGRMRSRAWRRVTGPSGRSSGGRRGPSTVGPLNAPSDSACCGSDGPGSGRRWTPFVPTRTRCETP